MVPLGEESTYRTAAVVAATLWDRSTADVVHIADSGNSVYQVGAGADRRILRLTNPTYRTRLECEAELEYLLHLDASGVRCNQPIVSTSKHLVEDISIDGRTILASLFTWAPGERIEPDSPLWNDSYIQAWGRILGEIHHASYRFQPQGPGQRWIWRDEVFLARAEELIPMDDPISRGAFNELMEYFDTLPQTNATFGMIHGDFSPQNFHYDSVLGITPFDFGNCCYHWYLNDIAVSFTRFYRFPPDRRRHSEELLLEGYRLVFDVSEETMNSIGMFLRMRHLYVYLSRLLKFGDNPTAEERRVLAGMQAMVHDGVGGYRG